ncbi:enamine deaminase RidA (YjgF/YER057c/UK114 family) [Azospirillum fermentarium]|mgnify:CR=1 FL=1|uniref:Rid family hydrolase n=1 Tax=Azospirillum fermentarium TaxID=1233114 RepID=UPI0022280D53|nr:Rid family hydrolase [Azospirillum fermentarium]MCW2247696.1 enamine deaminase RidA (YjgF/YER057c/UK114 family) [Azospirillum fermentarium]
MASVHSTFAAASVRRRGGAHARAVVGGRWVFVSGSNGFGADGCDIPDDAAEQAHRAFHNLRQALTEVEAGLDDIVRLRVYVSDSRDIPRVAPVLGDYFTDACPARSVVACPLADPRMKVEIEATARR